MIKLALMQAFLCFNYSRMNWESELTYNCSWNQTMRTPSTEEAAGYDAK